MVCRIVCVYRWLEPRHVDLASSRRTLRPAEFIGVPGCSTVSWTVRMVSNCATYPNKLTLQKISPPPLYIYIYFWGEITWNLRSLNFSKQNIVQNCTMNYKKNIKIYKVSRFFMSDCQYLKLEKEEEEVQIREVF